MTAESFVKTLSNARIVCCAAALLGTLCVIDCGPSDPQRFFQSGLSTPNPELPQDTVHRVPIGDIHPSGQQSLPITQPALIAISVTPANQMVFVDSTQQFHAMFRQRFFQKVVRDRVHGCGPSHFSSGPM